ncbi:metal ABC transporter solute-binding protein, Zn/Mn family [uncultured Limosilactobacillus sp.]|uniref:metal ABC transporter solute-binding protein, Zn/Mn family n=1 Tax=uncultured Limosilactobacillus sp. TaxID=2837629 RepID=UPI0025DA1FBB|nr:zinc ABC transporter substrate-binding protein [uncultured Limosilactobacillus sp.]
MKHVFRYLGLIIMAITLFVVTGRNQVFASSSSDHPIQVVTGLDFYGEAASQVAGRYGHVTSIINSTSIDPHDYHPGTKQAKQVSKANVVIENGLDYDPWLNKLVKNNHHKNLQVVNVGKSVAGKKSGDNEHVWYRPATMKDLAYQLADKYSKLDPNHAKYYQANAKKYAQSLQPVNDKINKIKNNVNPQRNKVAVSEPVFDYALKATGYQVSDRHFEKAIEDETDPSPKDIRSIKNDMKNHQLAFFVENSQTSDKVVNNLVKYAKKHDTPVLKVTESKPKGKTYKQWMMSQYQQLAKIQKQEQ